jgi:tRNA (adenine22-N1)-methyltransferase
MGTVLDKRLSLIASLCEGKSVADVGCDHGKLACYLVKNKMIETAIASDISEKCLLKARKLADANGVGAKIDTRLSDGLDKIHSREAETVVISGLGGDVIAEIIIKAVKEDKRFSHFVFGINSHAEKVRQAVLSAGHTIVFDTLTSCAGKVYTIIKTSESEKAEKLDKLQLLFGRFYKTDEGFKSFAKAELAKKNELLKLSPKSEKLIWDIANLSKALNLTDD